MSELSFTIIDVGWGDSILLDSTDEQGNRSFALIDCNDYEYERSSYIFAKRFFQRAGIPYDDIDHNFEWVLLTHGHADHARGLKRMLRTFGARRLWYPKSVPSTSYGTLIRYANRSSKVEHHQSVDATKTLPDFGDVSMRILWPEHDGIDTGNENNNSVVLALTLEDVTFVLTGDAEAPNWETIRDRLPPTTRVFQCPHHGARNGMFDEGGQATWLDALPQDVAIAMSCHITPHGHPDPTVVAELDDEGVEHFRTDRQFHLTFTTDGTRVDRRFSHAG